MRVLLSIGLGRLHFVPAAEALMRRGIGLTVILGWVPSARMLCALRHAGRCASMMGRIESRRHRWSGVAVRSCGLSEVVTQCLLRVCRLLHLNAGPAEAWGWQLFGRQSRRFLRDAAIFHVRSGAGQGGAIRRARELGMKVLVDHSIAHPKFLEQQLSEEYARNKMAPEFPAHGSLWDVVLKDCLAADALLVNSDFVRETFVQAGFPAEKLRVVYLGVEKEFGRIRKRPTEASGQLRLLFIGHFGVRKGAEYLVEAMRMLKERGVDAVLDVVGGGTRHGGQGDVGIIFHGKVAHDEVPEFLKRADVFVFPTLAEGCARSAMEAMAAGLCVVTTHESGVPIKDAETGFIVPSKDAVALADKIEWLALNRAVIERVGSSAAALVEQHYTWDAYAANVERVYCELTRL